MLKFSRDVEYRDGDEFTLVSLFDIHYGAAACAEDELARDLKKFGLKDKTFFIGGGDFGNNIKVRDRRFRFSELHPRYYGRDSYIEDVYDDLAAVIMKHTAPEQWLAVGDGNHEQHFIQENSTDPMKMFCERIGYVNRGGYDYMVVLNFHQTKKGGRGSGMKFVIYVNHGWGSAARTEGAAITKYSRTIMYYYADMYLFGHTHGLWAHPMVRIEPKVRGEGFKEKRVYVAECGTYLKTFLERKEPTYSEMKGYSPKVLGCARFTLRPNRIRSVVEVESIV